MKVEQLNRQNPGISYTDRQSRPDKTAPEAVNKGETGSGLDVFANDEFKTKYSREELEKVLDKVQESMEIFNKRLHFKVHEETNRVQVQVIDAQSDEVIKEIPPSKILDLMAAFQRLSGILFDIRA